MRVICDIEADGLQPTQIWCIVAYDIDTKKAHIFTPENLEEFKEFAPKVTQWIGHNFISFDAYHINRLMGRLIDVNKILDTLVVARLQDSSRSNSLDSWGERLGYAKGDFNDFSKYTQEMLEYCKRDVKLTYKIWRVLESFINDPENKAPLWLEHKTEIMCSRMHDTGFPFDIETCRGYHRDITKGLEVIDEELKTELKDRVKVIKEINPQLTTKGTLHKKDFRWTADLTPYEAGCPFTLFEYEPINLGSPKQLVSMLNDAGWKPYEMTKGHAKAFRKFDKGEITAEKFREFREYGWTVSEANLATLPETAPAGLKLLTRRLMLVSRLSVLDGFINAYNPKTKRIHGSFKSIGAWTHRMSHTNPNVANIPAVDSEYGPEFRGLFHSGDGILVGCDADGIQLRVLAHLMNDETFTHALIAGNKDDGTDAHSLNRRALGDVCRDRNTAKTFIYAWLLGAAAGKVANILGCTEHEARVAMKSFEAFYPGLRELKRKRIPAEVDQGFIRSLDGRKIPCPSQHLALAAHLQGGESIIMKLARVLWERELKKTGIKYQLVNFVHDEWQTIVFGTEEEANRVGMIQAKAIEDAGTRLKLNCPLAGSFKIGKNWKETH